MHRCDWVSDDPLYLAYHDTEWGVPQRDGRILFEMLMLESAQAGLSWITILRKREGYRAAFANFQPEVIAKWGEAEVETLVTNPEIVRHRGKIEATIQGARAWLEIEEKGSFSEFIWSYVDGTPQRNQPQTMAEVPAQTAVSNRLSKDLKKAGFKFCGPTIAYAFMQASGLVNDHQTTCFREAEVARLS